MKYASYICFALAIFLLIGIFALIFVDTYQKWTTEPKYGPHNYTFLELFWEIQKGGTFLAVIISAIPFLIGLICHHRARRQ